MSRLLKLLAASGVVWELWWSWRLPDLFWSAVASVEQGDTLRAICGSAVCASSVITAVLVAVALFDRRLLELGGRL